MLLNTQTIVGFNILATDEQIGTVHDFYIDDKEWTIRYLIADTGTWFSDKKVLIPAKGFVKPIIKDKIFPVTLTKGMIEASPKIDKALPVSRQFEKELLDFYKWNPYWAVPDVVTSPAKENDTAVHSRDNSLNADDNDPYLRSFSELIGYNIVSKKDRVGSIVDFLIDQDTWRMRYIIVVTREFLKTNKYIIDMKNIKDISWITQSVSLDLSRKEIESCPEFNSSALLRPDV